MTFADHLHAHQDAHNGGGEMPISYGSVCSGIEAASVAWHHLGWIPRWFAEIEPFPSAVLAHHWPDVPNLGDFTAIRDKVTAGTVEAPDVLVGGTPCQAFSVAGLRRSLDDKRGQLTLEFVRLANAIDSIRSLRGQRPVAVVWENVPGVLNTPDNAFGCFLAGLVGEDDPLVAPGGRWSNAGYVRGPARAAAWRILDAQYFGVAQRRRRVFVVASAGGVRPEQVLFEFDGVRRDSPPRRQQGQGAAADAAPGIGASGRGVSRAGETRGQDPAVAVQGFQGDIARTLQARHDSSPCADRGMDAVAIQGTTVGPADGSGPRGKGYDESGVQFTLTKTDIHAIAFEPGVAGRLGGHCYSEVSGTLRKDAGDNQMAAAFSSKDSGGGASLDLSPTMQSMGHSESHANGGGQLAVAFQATDYASGAFEPVDKSSPITTSADRTRAAPIQASGIPALAACVTSREGNRFDSESTTMIPSPMQVRRLTPDECAVLQGFPKGHARIPWNRGYWAEGSCSEEARTALKESCPDGPQYKAYGNSMAVPVMRWIGARIARQLEAQA